MTTVQNNHTEVQAKPACKFLRTGQKIKINASVQTSNEQLMENQIVQNRQRSKLLKKTSSFMSMTYSATNSFIENKQKTSPSKLFSTIYSPQKKSSIFGGFEQVSFEQNIMESNEKKSKLQSLLEYSNEKTNQLSSYLPLQHELDSELLLDSFEIPKKQTDVLKQSPMMKKNSYYKEINTKQSNQSNYQLTFKKSPCSLATPYTYDYPDAISFASFFHHNKYFSMKYQYFDNKLIINYHGNYHPSISQFHSTTHNILHRIKYAIHNRKISPLKLYKYLIQNQQGPYTSLKTCLLLHNIPFNCSKQIEDLVHYFFTQQNLQQLFEATFFTSQLSSTKIIKLKHNQYQSICQNLDDSLEIAMSSSIKETEFWYLIARINQQSELYKNIQQWMQTITG